MTGALILFGAGLIATLGLVAKPAATPVPAPIKPARKDPK